MKFITSLGLLWLCSLAAYAQEQPAPPAVEQPKPAPAPAPVKNQAGRSTFEETESVWSFSAFYWLPKGDGKLAGGRLSPDPPVQTIDLLGKIKNTPGVILTVPTGRSNRLEFTVWEAKNAGSTTATRDHFFLGAPFDRGDFLSTEYRIRSAKMTWNYMSFPYPVLDAKFRIKTLWEFQYVDVQPVITAPFTARPASGGNPETPATRVTGKRTILTPTLGLGMQYVPSPKHFRLEARGTAMAYPGKSQIWDVEGTATARIGNFEIFAGGKLFHYRTSPGKDQYLEGNLWGPMGGVRWMFR